MEPPSTGGLADATEDARERATEAVSSAINSARDTAASLTQRKGATDTKDGAADASTATEEDKDKSGPSDWAFASREKGPSPLGSFLFVFLRAADVYLQYALVRYDLLPIAMTYLPIGGFVIPHRLDADPDSSILGLGLTPYHTALTAFAFIAAFKQIIWQLFISEQKMPVEFAVIVAAFNTVLNTLNTALSLYSRSSAGKMLSYAFPFGALAFVVGIFLELVSEIQRAMFKRKPENKGKPYGAGLWSLATHINYGGYTLWRAGYACAAGRVGWGGLVALFVGGDFARRAIPSMDKYCEERYGKGWIEIRDKAQYRLLPYAY